MRYLAVSACLCFVLAACTFDDGDEATKASGTAVTGQNLVVDIGLARVEIDAGAIGTAAGQLAPGSKVELKVVTPNVPGRTLYSPIVEVLVKKADGTAATGLNLNPAATFEMSYDEGLAEKDNRGPDQLSLLKIDGNTTKALVHVTGAPVANNEWTRVSLGRARTACTSFSRFVMANKADTAPTPTPVALTGTVTTITVFTVFQLSGTGGTPTVNLAIPTADTTTPPEVLTLNDASYNAANPVAPTNRIITVTQGGTTFTSDAAAANVTVQLNTFTASASSGSITGTVVQQGGSTTLAINFTWTTGAPAAQALGGTVTDLAGRRMITLTDAAQAVQMTLLVPATLPNASLDPITFNDASFDATTPLAATGRIVTVIEAGVTYSSDIATVGSVTVTFTTFDVGTKAGTGTITGTAVSSAPSNKTLSYSFATTAGGTGGGTGTMAAGASVDITTTSTADESAMVYDGVDYVAVWLSSVGTTNRTLEIVEVDPGTLAPATQQSFEPSVNLSPAAGISAAVSDTFFLMVVGSTGTDAGTSMVHAVLYDYLTPGGTNISVGTGTRPRVVFNEQSGMFVIAWQQGADVMVRCYDDTGTPVAAAVTAAAAATLRGLATPDGTVDEALVTADDGSGIVGRYLVPSTGATSGTQFNVSTSGAGGVCAWDPVADQYLVITETTILAFFDAQVVRAFAAGGTTPVGTALTLAALTGITGAAGGDQGVLFTDANTNLYIVKGGAGGAALGGNPFFGPTTAINTDGTSNGPAPAAAGSGDYAVLAARGAAGARAVPLTVTP